MNIFITGINGFIGSSLARYLLDKGHRVSGSVRKTSDLSFLNDLPVHLFTGDIGDESFLLDCFKDQDIVYHIAALASDWAPLKTFHKINVQGTINAAKAALSCGVKRFVYVS
jgi:dihydroflavonol-4-reductase